MAKTNNQQGGVLLRFETDLSLNNGAQLFTDVLLTTENTISANDCMKVILPY